jgi:hypothetical protein
MSLTEHLRRAELQQSASVSMPIFGAAECMAEPHLCVFRGVCQSRRCQTTNSDCPRSCKGN